VIKVCGTTNSERDTQRECADYTIEHTQCQGFYLAFNWRKGLDNGCSMWYYSYVRSDKGTKNDNIKNANPNEDCAIFLYEVSIVADRPLSV